MNHIYPLSFLKNVSGSSDDAVRTKEFEKRIADFAGALGLLDKASSFFYLFNFVQMRYLYVSESIKDIMGYTARDWIDRGPDWVFTTVYPEDVQRFKDLHKALFQHYYSLPFSERKEHKYVWEVRVVRNDGKIIWLRQEGSFIEIDNDGKPMVTFDILTDTTQYKKDKSMTLTMFKNATSEPFQLYFPLSGSEPFTKREVELMKLLSEGLTSKEIGERLFISPHTVDTHRRHMLKKTRRKDSSKLIAYARENGLV